MTPEVSLRGRQMPASPIRKLAPLADEAKRRGTHVIHLNIGQPDLETPEPMRRRLASLKDKVLAYSHPVAPRSIWARWWSIIDAWALFYI